MDTEVCLLCGAGGGTADLVSNPKCNRTSECETGGMDYRPSDSELQGVRRAYRRAERPFNTIQNPCMTWQQECLAADDIKANQKHITKHNSNNRDHSIVCVQDMGTSNARCYYVISYQWGERPLKPFSSVNEHRERSWPRFFREIQREEKAFRTTRSCDLRKPCYNRGEDASSLFWGMDSQSFWVDTVLSPWWKRSWTIQELVGPSVDLTWTNYESRHESRIEDGESLKRFLKAYSENFELIASMLSCVQNSARPLHKSELEHAVWLSRERSSGFDTTQTMKQDLDFILNGSDCIFVEDNMGHIDFASSSMSTFLQNFRINGIDSSHTTMASICKRAIEQFAEKAENGYRMEAGAARFLKYAYEYANYHAAIVHATNHGMKCRIAEVKFHIGKEDSVDEICPCSVSGSSESPSDSDWIML